MPDAHARTSPGLLSLALMTSLLERLPEIVAEGKRYAGQILERLEGSDRISLQTREQVIPSRDSSWRDLLREQGRVGDARQLNRLIYGDNLLAMAALLAGDGVTPCLRGKIDLIYIDPPFDSKADYRTQVELLGNEMEHKPTVIEQFAYADTWHEGTLSYLSMLTPRLCLMRELLSDKGSLYVHIGPNVSHYVKMVLDAVFGIDNFLNQIIWKRTPSAASSKARSTKFPVNHDVIFFYSNKRDRYHFKKIHEDYSEKYKERFKYQDEIGFYRKASLKTYSEATKIRLKESERWIDPMTPGAYPSYKQYLHESKGKQIEDIWSNPDDEIDKGPGNVWEDLNAVNPMAKERLNYPTQKPEALISRIIELATDEGDFIADFFCGSGTALAVAERLGRRWIGVDLGKPACMITRKRLIDQEAAPFLYQHIGDYQLETARSMTGRRVKTDDLAQIILGLYGASPLAPEDSHYSHLGRVGRRLIYVDSPHKMTGLATLSRARALRDSHQGGWDRVTVLGWNFEPDIGQTIHGLRDDKLEVLVIPSDLLDRLKQKGKKLRADEVRFSSLQYLQLGEVRRERQGGYESLSLEIANYVLLSPEALNLDGGDREKLYRVIRDDPLALISYWSVDPDYDGGIFRSVWQDYRGNRGRDGDGYRVVRKARLEGLEVVEGPRCICVRAVDIFCFEAETVIKVA